MNREIKFNRVHFFDKEKTKFSHFSEWGVNINMGNHIADFLSPPQNNAALFFTDLQFTGQIDKNENDIYEGDLFIMDGITYKVFFNTSTACFDVENQDTKECEPLYEFQHNAYDQNNECEIEIIGNIYQNQI